MKTPNWKQTLTGVTFLTAAALLAGCESKEAKAERFAESGLAYLEEGDLESADLQFNNALFNDGQNVVALRGAARIAAMNDGFVRQGRMLARLLDVEPNDIEANNEFARLSLLANEVERAQEHANRVLAIEPNNIGALSTLAASLVIEDKSEESREVIERALAADPTNPEIYNLYAARSIREGNVEEALAIIDNGISQVENPETMLVIRLVLADQNLGETEVLDTFERLIAVAPQNGIYRQKLAEYILLKQQDLEAAKAMFLEALPYLEDKTPVYTRVVAIERQQNGDEAAEAMLKSFIASSTDEEASTQLRFLLPVFYCQTQDYEKCTAEFSTLAADPELEDDDRVRALNGIADVAIIQQNFEKAETVSNEILTLDPTNNNALVTQGQIALSREEPASAIESFRAALESNPDDAEGLVYLALAYEASDQTNFADAQFARALDQVGYLKPVVDQYRAFLIRNGEFDRSVEVLQRYLRVNPNDTEALIQRAEGAIAQGEFLEAEASARQLVTNDQFSARAGSILAQSLFSQERFADALPVAEEVLSETPNDPGNKILRASILQRLGRAEEAINELEAKIESGAASSVDYALLGDLYNTASDFPNARRVSIEGLSKFPDAEQLYVLGYISESRMQNTEGGNAILRDGISKAENTAQLRTLLSNELINARRFDDAIDVLRSLDADNALSPLTANNLASLLLENDGNEEEALRIARLLEGTENPYFADTLAWAYYKADQVQNAVRYARRAGSALQNNADVQFHTGVIEAALGEPVAAREALMRAKAAHNETAQTPMSEIDAAIAGL